MYADEGMTLLSKSLRATNVLSEEYRRNIESLALMAIGESYYRGMADAKKKEKQ